ncbi:MAG: Eco57I restriction-modification methylase domain-containing protein, partial [Tangfeifania sp.]
LFEPNDLEHKTARISNLEDEYTLPLLSSTVLKDNTGKRRKGGLNTLEYLFGFLDAYDFAGEGSEEIQEENKTLINASVLGLIFEKINGYKDGSFFTPGFITMYMARETIRRAVVEKFDRDFSDSGIATIKEEKKRYRNIDDVYNAIGSDFSKEQANDAINSLKICDPAVGSGHFLVSALNELIALKSELKILTDRNGRILRDYHVEVVNDELMVTDDEGRLFEYKPGSRESQRVQETLFHEKQAIIENCLFGVDINPNSVKICRLRLWIELLKNAYYRRDAVNRVTPELVTQSHLLSNPKNSDQVNPSHQVTGRKLETLPNIDINIKTGNSLISRYALDADMKKALKKSRWNIDDYRVAVMTYRNAETKEVKHEMEHLISRIKNDFESEIAANDKRVVRLSKLRGELFNLTNQQQLFDLSRREKTEWNSKVKKLTARIQKLETELEEIRTNKIYENAFEWRFEFPEVLNNDGDFTGFDVVIGNPPYIRQEEFSEVKPYLQEHFETYAGTADLYVYFIELGIRNLKTSGQFTFIVPNKWMRAGYGKALRNFIKKQKINTILDFGDLPVFEEATTYPSILSIQKTKPAETFDALTIESLTFPEGLEKFVAKNKADVLVSELQESGWSLTDANVQKLLAKLRNTGTPLSKYVDGGIYYGIKTGLNEAFVIDEATKEKLVAEDPDSAEIIKPFLAGRDIKRYRQPKSEKYLILIKNGDTQKWFGKLNEDNAWNKLHEKYPAVANHLIQFKEKAKKRYDKGQYWWELRACDYYEEFEKPKVMLPDISTRCEALIDADENFYCVNTAYIIPGLSKSDLGILNSKLVLFYYSNLTQTIRGGYFRFIRQYLEQIPFIKTDTLDEKVTQILALKKQDPAADT